MRTIYLPFLRFPAFIVGLCLLACTTWVRADPPARVARIAYLAGPVSLSVASQNGWVPASLNRPLTGGDRLWIDAGGQVELQLGGATLHLGPNTDLALLQLDDRLLQLQLAQGSLIVGTPRMASSQVIEIDTPNLALNVRRGAELRMDVRPQADHSDVFMRQGQAEAFGGGLAYTLQPHQNLRFAASDLRQIQPLPTPGSDALDRWASERDRAYDRSPSARHVAPDLIGYQDLDDNGVWRNDPDYGQVWYPSRVATDWAPYRDGHWSWIDPWGWTWVDDAPWGFAVTHYGRWARLGSAWAWVPGPVRSQAWYAPALVVFVGGNNFQLGLGGGNVGAVAWFPLAPREVYRPAYAVSRGYFENVNRSNTVINTTVINNYYRNPQRADIPYANRQVGGAVIAVPLNNFVQSRHVGRDTMPVGRDRLANGVVSHLAPAAPVPGSVPSLAGGAGGPPQHGYERPRGGQSGAQGPQPGLPEQPRGANTRPGPMWNGGPRHQQPPTVPAPAAPPVAAQPVAPAAAANPTPQTNNRPPRAQPQPAPTPMTLDNGLPAQRAPEPGVPAPAAAAPAAARTRPAPPPAPPAAQPPQPQVATPVPPPAPAAARPPPAQPTTTPNPTPAAAPLAQPPSQAREARSPASRGPNRRDPDERRG